MEEANSSFPLYIATFDFKAVGPQQFNLKRDETMVICLREMGDWLFGCPSYDPKLFGFVPTVYLRYLRHVDSLRLGDEL